eukprot:g13767.t1
MSSCSFHIPSPDLSKAKKENPPSKLLLLTPLIKKYGVRSPEIEVMLLSDDANAFGGAGDDQPIRPHAGADEQDNDKHDSDHAELDAISQVERGVRNHILSCALDKVAHVARMRCESEGFRRLALFAFLGKFKEAQRLRADARARSLAARIRNRKLSAAFLAFCRNVKKRESLDALLSRIRRRISRFALHSWRVCAKGSVRDLSLQEQCDKQKRDLEKLCERKQTSLDQKLARAVIQLWQTRNSELKTRCGCFTSVLARIVKEKRQRLQIAVLYQLRAVGLRQVLKDLETSCCTLAGFDKLHNFVSAKERDAKAAALLQLKAANFGFLLRKLDLSCQFDVKSLQREKKSLLAALAEERAAKDKVAGEKTELELRMGEVAKAVSSGREERRELEEKLEAGRNVLGELQGGMKLAVEKMKKYETERDEWKDKLDETEKLRKEEKAQLEGENEQFKKTAQEQLEALQVAIGEEKALLLSALEDEKQRSAHLLHQQEVHNTLEDADRSRRFHDQHEQLQLELEHYQARCLALQEQLSQSIATETELRRSLENFCTVQEVAQTKIHCESENLQQRVAVLEKQLLDMAGPGCKKVAKWHF